MQNCPLQTDTLEIIQRAQDREVMNYAPSWTSGTSLYGPQKGVSFFPPPPPPTLHPNLGKGLITPLDFKRLLFLFLRCTRPRILKQRKNDKNRKFAAVKHLANSLVFEKILSCTSQQKPPLYRFTDYYSSGDFRKTVSRKHLREQGEGYSVLVAQFARFVSGLRRKGTGRDTAVANNGGLNDGTLITL